MKTAIVTDSNSGITEEEALKAGVYVLPMPIIIDEKVYFEGKNITEEEFYAAQAQGAAISTSQPSPGDVIETWDRLLGEGYNQIVHVPMSSGLSQSCEAAKALAADYPEKVFVADNHRISVTLYTAVLSAAELAAQGMDGRAIKSWLEETAYNASIYITVNTLEYLKKGGRITPAAALLGSVLNIKPVLTIQGEKLDAFAKVRGLSKGEAVMLQALRRDLDVRFAGADLSRLNVCAAGTALSQDEIDHLLAILTQNYPDANVFYSPLSLSVGCHLGPGAIGMGFCF